MVGPGGAVPGAHPARGYFRAFSPRAGLPGSTLGDVGFAALVASGVDDDNDGGVFLPGAVGVFVLFGFGAEEHELDAPSGEAESLCAHGARHVVVVVVGG